MAKFKKDKTIIDAGSSEGEGKWMTIKGQALFIQGGENFDQAVEKLRLTKNRNSGKISLSKSEWYHVYNVIFQNNARHKNIPGMYYVYTFANFYIYKTKGYDDFKILNKYTTDNSEESEIIQAWEDVLK